MYKHLNLYDVLPARELVRGLHARIGGDINKIGIVVGRKVKQIKARDPEAAVRMCGEALEELPGAWRAYMVEYTWAKLACDELEHDLRQHMRGVTPRHRSPADASKERSEDEGWTEIE